MKHDITIIGFGGRDYSDYSFVCMSLDYLNAKYGVMKLIEGGAKGADRLCRQWAEQTGVRVVTVEADWLRLGKSAGPVRNERMAEIKPDMAVGFPGGRGTKNMAETAKRHGIEVWMPTLADFEGDRNEISWKTWCEEEI